LHEAGVKNGPRSTYLKGGTKKEEKGLSAPHGGKKRSPFRE